MSNAVKIVISAVCFAIGFVAFGALLDYLDAVFTNGVYSFDLVPDLVIPGGLGLALGAAFGSINIKKSKG